MARKGMGCGTLILLLILLLVIINIMSPDEETEKVSKPREIVCNNPWDGSVYQVELYLEKNLKDPNSLDAIDWSLVQKTDVPGAPYKYIVRCKYRAKNSFGGYVIEDQAFYLDAQGEVIGVENMDAPPSSLSSP